MKWQVTAELCIFQGEMAHKEASLHSNCHRTWLNQCSISSTSCMVISSRVVACTSQPVAFNGHPSTCGHHDRPQKQASAKADLSTFGSGVLEIS